jgi:large conductance mechanosensitive channel
MSGFRDFIARGNVLDLAVAVIIGAAFATIVASLTGDIIMPVIGALTGGLDFSSHYVLLGPLPEHYAGPTSYAALKAAGVPMLGYGQFITTLVGFLILAFVIYQLVKVAARMMPAKAEAVAGPSEEALLLREIRDALRGGSGATPPV